MCFIVWLFCPHSFLRSMLAPSWPNKQNLLVYCALGGYLSDGVSSKWQNLNWKKRMVPSGVIKRDYCLFILFYFSLFVQLERVLHISPRFLLPSFSTHIFPSFIFLPSSTPYSCPPHGKAFRWLKHNSVFCFRISFFPSIIIIHRHNASLTVDSLEIKYSGSFCWFSKEEKNLELMARQQKQLCW